MPVVPKVLVVTQTRVAKGLKNGSRQGDPNLSYVFSTSPLLVCSAL